MNLLPQIKTRGTLSERTYDILKKAIIELELNPGQMVTEEELSEQLGISRTPIRTALNRLLYEELIEVIPGKGTFIASFTEKEITDLLMVRKLLEGLSIQLATSLRTNEDLEEIEYLIHKQEQAAYGKYSNKQDYLDIDMEFHRKIAKMSQNKYLEKQLPQIINNCRRYLNASTYDLTMSVALDEHKQLLEQIKIQDSDQAVHYMKDHINNIRLRIKNISYTTK